MEPQIFGGYKISNDDESNSQRVHDEGRHTVKHHTVDYYIESLVVVKVHAGRAEAHITSVLLDVGSGPAAEGIPVVE